MSERFCLDTSFLINGWTKRYSHSVFPTLWARIDSLINDGTVFVCQDVYLEIERRDDSLFSWVKERKKKLVEEPPPEITAEMRLVMKQFPHFAAQGGSLGAADPWVIAHAKLAKATVVTDEDPAKTKPLKKTKSPKIPDVCEEIGLPWKTPIQFLEAAGVWI